MADESVDGAAWRILLVEDSEPDAELALRALRRGGVPVHSERVETADELRAALGAGPWDLILCDHGLPRFSVTEALAIVGEAGLDLPFVVLSGTIGEEAAVAALKAGAADVVLKANLGRLGSVAERELRAAADRRTALRLQQQIEQTQRLESLGLLAGGVAHDFNNLLGVILTYARFVAKAVADDPQARADLAAITEAAERAAQLTRQLLAFGRREIVDPRPMVLDDVLVSVENLLGITLGDGIDLRVVAGSQDWSVLADAGQMEQVVVNLAMNARDSMPDGGELTVSTRGVELDGAAAGAITHLSPGPHVCLEVADTGTGMTPDTSARAFEPFFTTKAKGEGSGLGLATVYGIVRQAGGDVVLRSEPGRGTVISVYLPAMSGGAMVRRPLEAAEPRGGGETILVVDDEDAFRAMVERILVGHGYETLAAAGADAARVAFESDPGRIDLLLTDVVMPGGSGIELASGLRADRPDLPVLYMSGHLGLAEADLGTIDPGDVVPKPFSESDLLRRVRAALDHHAEVHGG